MAQDVKERVLAMVKEAGLSRRFAFTPAKSPGMIVITDKTSRRSVTVPLFAFHTVRDALRGLFGPAEDYPRTSPLVLVSKNRGSKQ